MNIWISRCEVDWNKHITQQQVKNKNKKITITNKQTNKQTNTNKTNTESNIWTRRNESSLAKT